MSWPTRLVLCAPDRRAIFIPSTDCPRHNSVFVACRKSDHLQQLTECPRDSFVFLACRKTCHTRVSKMDHDACTCRLKQHLGFAQPTNPLRLLTPGWLCDGVCEVAVCVVPREIKAPTLVCMTEATQRYPLVLQATWLRAPAPRISGPVDRRTVPWTARGPFRGPLCFDRFAPVDRIF